MDVSNLSGIEYSIPKGFSELSVRGCVTRYDARNGPPQDITLYPTFSARGIVIDEGDSYRVNVRMPSHDELYLERYKISRDECIQIVFDVIVGEIGFVLATSNIMKKDSFDALGKEKSWDCEMPAVLEAGMCNFNADATRYEVHLHFAKTRGMLVVSNMSFRLPKVVADEWYAWLARTTAQRKYGLRLL